MAKLLNLKTFTDARGNLTVVDKAFDFDIKRVFYIYGVDDSIRGRHRHKKTIQAAVCIQGSCRILNDDGEGNLEAFLLDNPSKCMIIEPKDFHQMDSFTPDAILMVFASEHFDAADYIHTPYETTNF
ncbi:MAG: hypothetical protein RL757_567 [Bacteroidota bacterium]|jgi:dTDP-4-dehydrorhamnose 3,5-epimerase-like enzyme